MSPSPGQSYYEIALTHRQVLAVFVVLLLAVLTAFAGGVWVGRRGPMAEVQTVDAQTIRAEEVDSGEPLERFDFFSREENGALGNGPESEPSPADTEPIAMEPLPPLGEEGAPSPDADADADAEPDTPGSDDPSDPPEEPADEPVQEPAEQPAEEPVPAEETPEPAGPVPAPAASEPVREATLVVQVFSSSNQVQAQSVVDRLRSGGFPAVLSPVEVSGRTMYRVRIGPYAERADAERVATQVRQDYRLETWITE